MSIQVIKKYLYVLIMSTFFVAYSSATSASDDLEQIKKQMVERSIQLYSGSCPCPYNADRAGRRCGGRSAYSKPGGADPFCYTSDISDEAARRFKERH